MDNELQGRLWLLKTESLSISRERSSHVRFLFVYIIFRVPMWSEEQTLVSRKVDYGKQMSGFVVSTLTSHHTSCIMHHVREGGDT